MAIGIDDLDFDVELEPQTEEPKEQTPIGGEESLQLVEETEDEDDILISLLKDKGIIDPNRIKIENEEGEIEEVPFDSLERDELLNILKTQEEITPPLDIESELDDSEIDLLNQIRTNFSNPEEFINTIRQQAVQEFIEQNNQPSYQIDDLSDDELYILDLTAKVPDLSEEQANDALERAKQDMDLYSKQVGGLRTEYKALEDTQRSLEQLSKQAEDEELYKQFTDAIVGTITSLNKIGNLDVELDVEDQNEIANFILTKDEAGMSYFAKTLNDPKELVNMAWFALHGQETIDLITDYFTELIKQVSKSRYNQGLKDAQEGKKPATKRVAFGGTAKSAPKQLSIDDLED